MRFVLENLAIGSYKDALNPPVPITALLNVASERDVETERRYHKVPLIDMQPVSREHLNEAVEWIRDHISQHKIMVFCNAGIGRSPSVVVGYICCFLGCSFDAAVEFVATRKPDIYLLPGLMETIIEIKSTLLQTDDALTRAGSSYVRSIR
jgi:protein-tyrosine phosphatase